MDRESFLTILTALSPEELNDFLERKGKRKHVNLVTFEDETQEKERKQYDKD